MFLSEQNCHLFPAPYLTEFRHLSGVTDAFSSFILSIARSCSVSTVVYRRARVRRGHFLRHLRSTWNR